MDPAARSWLLPYALSGCREAEALDFEVHLLACAACFRDFKCLARVGDLLQELVGPASPALDRRRSASADKPAVERGADRRRSSDRK